MIPFQALIDRADVIIFSYDNVFSSFLGESLVSKPTHETQEVEVRRRARIPT